MNNLTILRHRDGTSEFTCTDCHAHVFQAVDDGYDEPVCYTCRWYGERPWLRNINLPVPMKALTVWQPWATLIVIGAKPYEFRRWDFRARARNLVGQRIVIHAGSRPMRPGEISEIWDRLDVGESALVESLARPLLENICRSPKPARALELSAGLGTAILGEPQRVIDLFKDDVADSGRLDQHMWAWPLSDIRRFDTPVPSRGAQGFWNWTFSEA